MKAVDLLSDFGPICTNNKENLAMIFKELPVLNEEDILDCFIFMSNNY